MPNQWRGECNRRPLVLDASTGRPHEDQSLRPLVLDASTGRPHEDQSLRGFRNGNQARPPQSQQDKSLIQNESNQNVSSTTIGLIAPHNDWVMSTGFNPGEQSLQISAANQAAIQYLCPKSPEGCLPEKTAGKKWLGLLCRAQKQKIGL